MGSDNGGGLSDDVAAGEESADEGPAVTEEPPIECPATWEAIEGGCYKFITDSSTFNRSTAEDTCNAYDGAKLAVLDTYEKRAAVYEYLVADDIKYDSFHVGARRVGDKYLWDGTTVEVDGWSIKYEAPDPSMGDCVLASADTYSATPGKYD